MSSRHSHTPSTRNVYLAQARAGAEALDLSVILTFLLPTWQYVFHLEYTARTFYCNVPHLGYPPGSTPLHPASTAPPSPASSRAATPTAAAAVASAAGCAPNDSYVYPPLHPTV